MRDRTLIVRHLPEVLRSRSYVGLLVIVEPITDRLHVALIDVTDELAFREIVY